MGTLNKHNISNLISYNILDLTFKDFQSIFQRELNKSNYFAKPLYKQVMQNGVFKPEILKEFIESYKTLKLIENKFNVSNLKPIKIVSNNYIEKIIFQTKDKLFIETVIVPMKNHKTLCISSQIGCKIGCVFCQTGTMPFKRNLEVNEIISQVYYAKYIKKEPIRNVVFMGMGEPLDNFKNVTKSIDILNDIFGFNMKRTHVTLSTSGLVNKIDLLAKNYYRKCLLAVSLNAANDETRSKIMPINKKYNLKRLKKSLLKYPLVLNNRILLEYVLIDDLNDSLSSAKQVVEFCKDLKVRLNIIPCNKNKILKYNPPTDKKINDFVNVLIKSGLHVIKRKSKGEDIFAACGQLDGSL